MNTTSTPTPPAPSSPGRRIFIWFLGLMAFCGVALVVAVVSVVTLNRDAAALRDEVLDAIDHRARTQVQLSVGPTLLAATRSVLAFIPEVDAEARLALSSVRRASVGVYELSATPSAAARATMLKTADGTMNRRGWTRAVAVNDGDDLVLVYLRENIGSGSKQKVCVAVCSERQLVVVAGTIDAAPLAQLVARHSGFASRW